MTDKPAYDIPHEPEINFLTSQFEYGMLFKIAEVLADYLLLTKAYSVNAKQLGMTSNSFMIMGGLFCHNPKVILYGSNRVKMDEYSSAAREHIAISRPESIVVGYNNFKGERVVRDLVGIESRYFQHELDNLSGIDWRTRATPNERLKAVKRVLH